MDWPHPVEAESHIVSELGRAGVDYKDGNRLNFKLCCPFPHEKGPDIKYKLEITRDGRKAHCWSCDWKGSWNKLAKELGVSEFGKVTYEGTYTAKVVNTNVFAKLSSELGQFLEESLSENTYELPSKLTRWKKKSWRGLSRSFLSKIPTYSWKQRVKTKKGSTFYVERILWPYYQNNNLVGYVGRRLDKIDFQKYFRVEGCNAKECLFPFDYVKSTLNTSYIVLVEGEVDALVLCQAGISALSILGSTNWSDYKRNLLLSLGTKRIFILMDPDPAGKSASRKISKKLDSYFDVKVLNLQDCDPGDMDEDQLSWLLKTVSAENS